jgi:hypothetical protein
MPVILALGRLRQEEHKFEASLGSVSKKEKEIECWWLTPVIYVLGRLRLGELWFKASRGK